MRVSLSLIPEMGTIMSLKNGFVSEMWKLFYIFLNFWNQWGVGEQKADLVL